MKIIEAQILSVRADSGGDFVVFQFVRDDGKIEGPRAEIRPKGADHQAFVDAQIPVMDASLNPVVPTVEEQIREALKLFEEADLKAVLGLTDETVGEVKGGGK